MTRPGEASHEDTSGRCGEQRLPHKGWRARERDDHGIVRSPLQEDPASNRDEAAELAREGKSRSLRSYEIPYATARNASTTMNNTTAASATGKVSAGLDERGITLRCMYTNQKTKKRKTWSDGAVKCCPKRQRVSLYRWSEALGVTEKLLGEIYLTVPQYEAFITQGEPELEMELYIVSLDGVVQADDHAPGGPTTSSTAASAESAVAGVSAGGVTTTGKKRRLFKAFKPPARRELPPAPPSEDPWGLPPGRMYQPRNGDRSGDRRFSSVGGGGGGGADESGVLPPRTTYTGFGHVESLWDEDDDDDCGEGQGRREDGLGPVGLSGEGGAGLGSAGAGPGYRSARDDGDSGAGMFPRARSEEASYPQQREQRSAGASAEGGTHDWMWGPTGGGHRSCSTPPRASPGPPHDQRSQLPRPALDFDGAFAGQQEAPHRAEPVPSRQGGPPTHLEIVRGDSGAEGPWQSSSGGIVESGDHDDAGGHRRSYPGSSLNDCNGSGTGGGGGVEGEPFVGSFVAEYDGVGARAPDACSGPAGGGGGGGGGAVGMRSTQDILSLFSGFGGTPCVAGGNGNGTQQPRERETAAAPLLQSRGPNGVPLEPAASGGVIVPAGGGIRRAADMRRAQKEARAAAGLATPVGGLADAVIKQARAVSAPSAAGDSVFSEEWDCATCGVRGSPSSVSCRVCGAERRAPRNDGAVGLGGDVGVDDIRGDTRTVDRDNQRGLGGDDFNRGGGRWQDQEWEGVADAQDVEDEARAHDGDALGAVGGTGGVPREGGSVAGRDRSVSSCESHPALPHKGDQIDGEGTIGSTALEVSSNRRTAGARMRMDIGSSSDSDDA